MKTLTILSGKGGVGKSSITASLAIAISKDKRIICADCDVDASNLNLVLGASDYEDWRDLSTNEKAVFDEEKCISCKICVEDCYFNAIVWKENNPVLKDFSCEGCGLCKLICPVGAISLQSVSNAKIGHALTDYGFSVVSAQLKSGASGSGKVVTEVRKLAERIGNQADLMVIDSAAGIGCPVIASVTGSDYAIVVTEPTPSGFSDMKRAIDILNHFKVPYSIILNKFDINKTYSEKIEKFAEENGKKIIARIPFDKKFALALTKALPIIRYEPEYEDIFKGIKESLYENIFIK